MKVSKHDKILLFEQEFLTLLFLIILGVTFNYFQNYVAFYFISLLVGFALYFWMVYDIHTTGKKHEYFEHTSSFLMIAQTGVALELVGKYYGWHFFTIICLIVAVIMYSVSLSRIFLFKAVFASDHAKTK
jgi:lipoprotein signal peptidase